jgi:hypothetical protein
MERGRDATEHPAVRSEAALLCTIAGDAPVRALAACARAWAGSTRSRLVFVQAGGIDPQSARARLAAVGIAAHELRVLPGEPESAVVEVIGEERPWLSLVACSLAPSNGTLDACAALLRHAESPVGVLPPGAAGNPGPVVCAVSLGEDDEAAVRFSSALASRAGQPLLVESVLGPSDAVREAAARARGSVHPATRHDGAARANALAGRLVDVAGRIGAGALVLAERAEADGADLPAEVARQLRAAAPCLVVSVRP